MTMKMSHVRTMGKIARIIDSSYACRRRHCYKVEQYSLIVCRELNVSPMDVKIIKVASMLHDIGKIGIDLDILTKTTKLTAEDWKQVHMHPDIGANIVGQIGFLKEVAPTIRYHHARFEGGGYPDPKISGSDIPIGARIIATADAFDAMINDRPYRKAMPGYVAMQELKRCSGSQFDPSTVNALLRYFEREQKEAA
jgi:putative nucleotidyltransferase with HDIG domain